MGGKDVNIVQGCRFRNLTAKWCWNTPSGRIWKCDCKCGATCYVKESALRLHIIGGCPDCEAARFIAKKNYRRTLPKYKKRKKQED
mgnify:CR=1 FL=1